MDSTVEQKSAEKGSLFPDFPLVIWLIVCTLLLGLLAGYDSRRLIADFNAGYGAFIGEFALILVASFVLASALEQQNIALPSGVPVGIAPFAGAGMVCPDTAYAALAPMCRRRKLAMAFGAYAGFKLLFPASPLIVATMFGADISTMLILCLIVFVPVWAAGVMFGRFAEDRLLPSGPVSEYFGPKETSYGALVPFTLLALLIVAGVVADMRFNVWLDFLTSPKGALVSAAVCALAMIPKASRRPAVDKGIRRAAGLLLIIGAASAFSRILTEVLPVADLFSNRTGLVALLSIFLLTAAFKLIQGSSMSTLAAIGPVAAPIVVASGVSPGLAVLAVCLGSFVAIMPNDSYYWLVRQDALAEASERQSIAILFGGAVLQALVGLGALALIAAFWKI
jgi:gluconate:H+ symporter, GntP family